MRNDVLEGMLLEVKDDVGSTVLPGEERSVRDGFNARAAFSEYVNSKVGKMGVRHYRQGDGAFDFIQRRKRSSATLT